MRWALFNIVVWTLLMRELIGVCQASSTMRNNTLLAVWLAILSSVQLVSELLGVYITLAALLMGCTGAVRYHRRRRLEPLLAEARTRLEEARRDLASILRFRSRHARGDPNGMEDNGYREGRIYECQKRCKKALNDVENYKIALNDVEDLKI